jgi:protein involved in polysaccharide export with SLBB domain
LGLLVAGCYRDFGPVVAEPESSPPPLVIVVRCGADRLGKSGRAHAVGKFLQEPQVMVTVVEYRPIYVFGDVVKPGSYPFRPGFNALTAVTEAGGLTYRGSKDRILIQQSASRRGTNFR